MFRQKRRHVDKGQIPKTGDDKSIKHSKKRSKAEALNITAELNISTLPLDILVGIFQYLLLKDLLNTDLVSKQFHVVARNNYLWGFIFLQYYPKPIDEDSIRYRQALIERLRSNRTHSLGSSSGKGTSSYSFSLLLLYLKNNDLKNLKAAFPTYSYLKSIFIVPLSFDEQLSLSWGNADYKETLDLLVREKLFSRLPQRLISNPRYQEGLNYLYEIVCAEHDKAPDQNIKCSPYVFTSGLMRAILFNQPYQTLVDLKNQGQDIDKIFSDKLADELWDRPIRLAVVLGNIEQVKYLIALGVNLNIKFTLPEFIYGDCNLIKLAAYYRHHYLAVHLMEVLKDKVDITKMYERAYLASDLDFLTFLTECGIEINFQVLKEKNADRAWKNFVYLLIKGNYVLLIHRIQDLLDPNEDFISSRVNDMGSSEILTTYRPKYNLLNIAAEHQQHGLLNYFLDLFKDKIDVKETCKQSFICGDVKALTCFLQLNIEIAFKKLKDETKGHALWELVILRVVQANHSLLAKKILVIDKHHINWSFLLRMAAERGYKEMVSLLLQEVADNKMELFSSLTIASEKGHLGVVKVLVESGVQTENYFGQCLYISLKFAISNNHTEVADYLFAKIKQIRCAFLIKIAELIDLYFCVLNKNWPDMVMLLLKNGIDIEQKNEKGKTALMIAIKNGHNECAAVLMEFRANTIRQRNMNISGISFYQSPASPTLPPLGELFDVMDTEKISL